MFLQILTKLHTWFKFIRQKASPPCIIIRLSLQSSDFSCSVSQVANNNWETCDVCCCEFCKLAVCCWWCESSNWFEGVFGCCCCCKNSCFWYPWNVVMVDDSCCNGGSDGKEIGCFFDVCNNIAGGGACCICCICGSRTPNFWSCCTSASLDHCCCCLLPCPPPSFPIITAPVGMEVCYQSHQVRVNGSPMKQKEMEREREREMGSTSAQPQRLPSSCADGQPEKQSKGWRICCCNAAATAGEQLLLLLPPWLSQSQLWHSVTFSTVHRNAAGRRLQASQRRVLWWRRESAFAPCTWRSHNKHRRAESALQYTVARLSPQKSQAEEPASIIFFFSRSTTHSQKHTYLHPSQLLPSPPPPPPFPSSPYSLNSRLSH